MRALLLSGCLALVLLTQQAAAQTLLVVGDSISAALGLDTSQGWVALLQKRLADEGYDYRVVNASVSGDTSAGGLARLPALLAEEKPALVVIELGGNDGLRGMAPAQLQQNLASMAQKARAEGAKVLVSSCRRTTARATSRPFPRSTARSRRRKRPPWCRFSSKGSAGSRG